MQNILYFSRCFDAPNFSFAISTKGNHLGAIVLDDGSKPEVLLKSESQKPLQF